VTTPNLYLISPVVDQPDAFGPLLAAACAAVPIAALQLRLGAADERTLVKNLKTLAPLAQEHGAAVVLALVGDPAADLPLIAARGGADGMHASGPSVDLPDLRGRLKEGRILGVGGLRTKDEAMGAGEAGVDYLLFGEPRADGSLPDFERTLERAAWWAEIFETPCVAFAPSLETVAAAAGTGAEFLGLGDAVWDHPEGPAEALRRVLEALEPLSAGARP
jgi:thiamine-phosphate pyrophosphorylase